MRQPTIWGSCYLLSIWKNRAFICVIWYLENPLSVVTGVGTIALHAIFSQGVQNVCSGVNSLAPGKFKRNFRYVIFKRILVIDGWRIFCEIALIWMSPALDFTDDQSTLVQVPSHYLSQWWPRSLTPHGVTRLQWVIKVTYVVLRWPQGCQNAFIWASRLDCTCLNPNATRQVVIRRPRQQPKLKYVFFVIWMPLKMGIIYQWNMLIIIMKEINLLLYIWI